MMKLTLEQLRHQFWLDHPHLDRHRTPLRVITIAWEAYKQMMEARQ
jgi:hypothetical protein